MRRRSRRNGTRIGTEVLLKSMLKTIKIDNTLVLERIGSSGFLFKFSLQREQFINCVAFFVLRQLIPKIDVKSELEKGGED